MIGYAMCGSFCTVERSIAQLERLVKHGYDVQPIMSDILYTTDTRFGKCEDIRKKVADICGRDIIHTISEAEPLGPSKPLSALVIAPCTGNTLAKLASGITDTAVCMATKAHLRNDKPVIIALASNDALSTGLGNIAVMMSRKNIFFVPLSQDDAEKKPHSLVCDFNLIEETLNFAMIGKRMSRIIY